MLQLEQFVTVEDLLGLCLCLWRTSSVCDAALPVLMSLEDLLGVFDAALPVFSSFVYQKHVFLHLMNYFFTLVKVWLILISWLKWRNFILGQHTQPCSLLLIKYVFILLGQGEVKMHSMIIFFFRILYSF